MRSVMREPTRRGKTRRQAIRNLAAFMAGSPVIGPALLAQAQPGQGAAAANNDVIRPPEYRDEIMRVINLHEFEAIAKKKLSIQAYDYIAAGAGDELTLQANRDAFDRFWIRRKVMVDVSKVDTTVDLLGQKLQHPILLGPV